jgi:Leucine-rich repeat (LRR) protein
LKCDKNPIVDLDGIEEYTQLVDLSLNETNLRELPISIQKCTHLRSIQLKSCMNMEMLPLALTLIPGIESIDLSHSGIEEIPPSINKLKKLKHLILGHCESLDILPVSLLDLELETLELIGSVHMSVPPYPVVLKGKEEVYRYLFELPEEPIETGDTHESPKEQCFIQ